MKIKICGITNVKDALLAAQLGADYIGCIFYKQSPRYISFEKAAEIKKQLQTVAPHCKLVAVVVHPQKDEIRHIEKIADIIQFSGKESPEECTTKIPCWKVIHIKDVQSKKSMNNYPHISTFVFDTFKEGTYGGTGKTFDFSLAFDPNAHIIIAGGLNPDNIQEAIAQAQPWGVDVCSGVEEAPGMKNEEKLRAFFQNVS